MPYFAIKEKDSDTDICVCHEEAEDSVQAEKMLGPGEWIVREISENEANKFAEVWANGEVDPDDICSICGSPRSRVLRGEIVLRYCNYCDMES